MIYFSVVIPLYNKAKHIERTINRVLSQSYPYFEIIVIDDGSTDSGADIVTGIDDKRVLLFQKTNEGVSKARNKGVSLARNEFIAFLDADDEWEPNYLESMADLINRYPDAALYATNYKIIERNGETYSLDYPEIPTRGSDGFLKNYFTSSFEYTPLWTSAVCVRKEIFMQMGGFPLNIKNGEDLDLWCRIALKYPIAYINKPLAIYRRDSENMLSRSVVDPCWFPFLENYQYSTKDIIKDTESIEKYIVQRQLEAASASLLILKDRKRCNTILKKIKHPKWNIKKYCVFSILQHMPYFIINYIYSKRDIKTFDEKD